MIASNAEFTLNLYCKRKSRSPTDSVHNTVQAICGQKCGHSKLITTTLWQDYRSRTKIFAYRTSEHTVQVEEGDELCPGGTELSKRRVRYDSLSLNLNFASVFGSSVLSMAATPPIRPFLTHPQRLVASSGPYVSPESGQTWHWRGRGIVSGFDQRDKRLRR
jgi:hypothetical protein